MRKTKSKCEVCGEGEAPLCEKCKAEGWRDVWVEKVSNNSFGSGLHPQSIVVGSDTYEYVYEKRGWHVSQGKRRRNYKLFYRLCY